MIEYYIAFSSITHAMKAEKQAKLLGVRCSIVRTPSALGVGGCGYSLKIKSSEPAKTLLKEIERLNIKHLGFFSLTDEIEVALLS